MTRHPMLRAGVLLAMSMLLTACASTEPAAPDAPPPASTSTAEAEARLTAVAAERSAVEARFTEREIVCYDKFFVNRCLDEAREQRRIALVEQREIEIEAARYLRQAKVDARDRAMAVAEAAYQEEEARLAANPPPVKAPAAATVAPARTTPAESRAARTKRQQDAAARAENTASQAAANAARFAQRRAESLERQQQVARRLAERDAKAAKRAADAAKKAAAQPQPVMN